MVMVLKMIEIKKNMVGCFIKVIIEILEKGENLEKLLEKEKN